MRIIGQDQEAQAEATETTWERAKVLLGVFFTFAFLTADVLIFVDYFSR